MTSKLSDEARAELTEVLAAIEHERWSHWQTYLHGKGVKQPDGSLLLPADLVRKWERQMSTPYAGLSATEQQSDRDQVNRYLPTVLARLTSSGFGD